MEKCQHCGGFVAARQVDADTIEKTCLQCGRQPAVHTLRRRNVGNNGSAPGKATSGKNRNNSTGPRPKVNPFAREARKLAEDRNRRRQPNLL